jgi:hypothetical protein
MPLKALGSLRLGDRRIAFLTLGIRGIPVVIRVAGCRGFPVGTGLGISPAQSHTGFRLVIA